MFCFGRRAKQQAETVIPPPPPPITIDKPPKTSEDVISELSSDGKYEVDIPTPSEFNLAKLDNIRFIDSDRHDSESTEANVSTNEDGNSFAEANDVFLAGSEPPPVPEAGVILMRTPIDSTSSSNNSETLTIPRIMEHLSVDDLNGRCSTASTADIGRIFSSSHHSSMESAIDISSLVTDGSPTQGRSPAPGPRFKLLHEGDINVCKLNHTRTVISKILSSKFLRRWETHHLYVSDTCIFSKTPTGFFESPVMLSSMEEIYTVARWDSNHKYCLRIVLLDGSLLLQAKNAYTRDQWYNSLLWKRNIYKFRNTLFSIDDNDLLLRELKCFIDIVMVTPLQDECFTSGPLDIISKLIVLDCWPDDGEAVLILSGPIVGTATLPEALAIALCHICRNRSLTVQIKAILHQAARRILKHNVDFGKAPHLRRFLQDFISALYRDSGGSETVRAWVGTVHGPGFNCPHPRVLPNLAAACLAAFHSIPPLASPESGNLTSIINYSCRIDDDSCRDNDNSINEEKMNEMNKSETKHYNSYSSYTPMTNTYSVVEENNMLCFSNVIDYISTYSDWAESLGAVLQPVPIPAHVLQSRSALAALASAVYRLGTDQRCAVHRHILPLRAERPGWLQILCPTRNNPDSGRLQQWGDMLSTLLNCCCKRKCFLIELAKMLPACLLLCLRAHQAGLESLCLMLEWEVLEEEQSRVEAVQALRSTTQGRRALHASCQRQVHLKKLQQKGGPRRLTLPSCATDADVARLLSAGSFGNLECLSLAFTHVTSAVAEQLIKLPSLRYLNLWATQFGDAGVLLIVEHLHRLQVLNLCETPVSDVGIEALAALSSLRKLNLNSTKLSAATWARLQPMLPALQECDVRYTDAW